MNTKPKADWIDLDVNTLTAEQNSLLEIYRTQYRAMKAAKVQFEDTARGALTVPEGKAIVFNYNYGKLSFALVDGKAKVAKNAKAPVSLAAYLAERAQAGLQA